MDDLMSDKNAESPTITKDIKKIVYRAARQALHPTKRLMLWTGTPFNKSDPLYEAAGTKAWTTRVYPICEKFPVARKDFKGAWEDRFPYEMVLNEYNTLKESGEIARAIRVHQNVLLRKDLSPFKVPISIAMFESGEIPWTPTFKVRRHLLTEMIVERSGADGTT